MKWDHRLTGFDFETVTELNEKIKSWSDEGWEALSCEGKYEAEVGEKFRVFILFKRMRPLEINGDID